MTRVKGTQLMGVIKPLRKNRKVAYERVPAHLRHYFEDRILAAGWYPEADLRDLVLVLGELIGERVPGNVYRFMGREGAERDFSGIYTALVRKGDPEWTVRQVPRGWRLYRDTSDMIVEHLEPGKATVLLDDLPEICPEMAEVNAGYLEGALRAAGAINAAVVVERITKSTASFSLSWDLP